MGIIANDGDIIVDAVLTDVGREFLARNDGSFEIVRYTFADDEIDYSLFVANTRFFAARRKYYKYTNF